MKLVILASSLTHSIMAIDCVSPKFTYWNQNPSVLVFVGGAFGRPLGPEDGALMNGIMILSFLCPSSTALLQSLSYHTLQPWECWVFEAASPLRGWDPREGTESMLPPLSPQKEGTLDSSCTLKVPLGHTWIIAKIDFPEVPSQGHFWNLRAVALYPGPPQTILSMELSPNQRQLRESWLCSWTPLCGIILWPKCCVQSGFF